MTKTSPTIQILSPQMTALIAAGEVVDRPASIVKELLENALDAGAKAINVEVAEGGLRLIRVSDDGCGLTRTDASLALQAFATSKIRLPSDLQAISAFGFRGEALSSIAAVAQLSILTRTANEVEGTLVSQHQGQLEVEPAASPVGMQVNVQNLFAQTPARRKFLKAPLRELELIQQTFIKYALAFPQVAFRLVADGKPRFALPPGTALERIAALLGRDFANDMLAVQWEALDLRINGFISAPSLARSRRDRQYFYVNNRPIRSGLLAVMLERPYAGLLPPGRYPAAVLNIQIDPAYIDVNVHPQKAEVRFSAERRVYSALSQAVANSLHNFPRVYLAGENALSWPFAGVESTRSLREASVPYQVGRLNPLAQIHHTYILAQSAEGILIIDQHAAHEQVLYEQISAGAFSHPLESPLQLELTAKEITLLNNHLSLFNALGFQLEPFGERAFLIRAIPQAVQAHLHNQVTHNTLPAEGALVTTLLEELHKRPNPEPEIQLDKLAQKSACVCAIKGGDGLNEAQMQTLLDALVNIWSPSACPHGRPVFVSLSLEELERRFGRR